jgi:hypothetical protein
MGMGHLEDLNTEYTFSLGYTIHHSCLAESQSHVVAAFSQKCGFTMGKTITEHVL